MPELPRVTILGSLNTDISVAVARLPGPGETVLGSAAQIGPGGKGANQAVAAARLGASVRMAGCRGADDFGDRLAAGLSAEGVDVAGVRAVAGASSGLALITVDTAGENVITVAPGANALAGEPEVAAAFAAGCDVLVLSAEVPAATLASALARARVAGITTVLNLAPVPEGAADLLAGGVDWLVVNVTEAAAVLGRPLTAPDEAAWAEAGPGADGRGEAGQPVTGMGYGGGAETGGAEAGGAEAGGAEAGGAEAGGAEAGGAGVGGAETGAAETGAGDVWQAVAELVSAGARHAVITLGAAGAVVAAAQVTTAGSAADNSNTEGGRGEDDNGDGGNRKGSNGDMGNGLGGAARPGPGAGRPGPGAARPGLGAAPPRAGAGWTFWRGEPALVPGFAATAVDSVGAGDAFVGALAVALARDAKPISAVRAACAAGAAAVTRRGAQAALPGLADVRAVTGQQEWPQFLDRKPPTPGPAAPGPAGPRSRA
jgi:ribokinase